MTTDQFITAVLSGLGLEATPNRIGFFKGLAAAEGTTAKNNPFATSRVINRGETTFNSHGVKNYQSAADGVKATVETFKLGYYKQVRRLLRQDAPIPETAKALAASPYVGGSQAVKDRHAANIVSHAQNAGYESPALDGSMVAPTAPSYASASRESRASRILDLAKEFMGTAYVWGGASPKGFDCSGFVKYLLEKHGYQGLPHYAADQFKQGSPVEQSELRPGDLVFFNMKSDGPGHVGMYVGNGEFIHASGSQTRQGTGPDRGVKISKLEGWYQSNFAGARRLADMGEADILDEPTAPQTPQGPDPPAPVVFSFEDPSFQVPFEEPGSVPIPSPNRNYAETWKLIGATDYADLDSQGYAGMAG